MTEPRIGGWRRGDPVHRLFDAEWLVTNGLGGYAAGSLGGFCTRRFHGLLIAALAAPLGRTMFVPYLEEHLLADGHDIRLTALETTEDTTLPDLDWLDSIELQAGLPVWRF